MNPLVGGLFNQFRETENLHDMSDSDAFELFAAHLTLPDAILSQSELTDLLLDSGTIGVDVAVMEINGQVAWDRDDVKRICEASQRIEVALHFIQAKQSSSVDSAQILAFGDIVKRFLNKDELGLYPRLSAIADGLHFVFANYAAILRGSPSVALRFVTTASRSSVADKAVTDRASTVKVQLTALGFVANVNVDILGADELHDAWVKKNHANEVEIQLEKQVNLPKMLGIDQAILGVVSVNELLKLIEHDDGTLDERVFYDNVRGFKGEDNPVNRQILTTLSSSERNLLPVLNNGVTVVASSYTPKPGDAISISGYQIVNGCQTSHCLHLAQAEIGLDISRVFVPLRIVVTNDEDVATRIISATNSQTEVQENDLVALTKFQKKLDAFYDVDQHVLQLAYERRSGQFYGLDVTKTRVVTIYDQMRAVSAVFLDTPHVAARYAGQLYSEVGDTIFRDDHKLVPYAASAFALYRIENAFRNNFDPRYKPVRYHILMVLKYLILKKGSAPLNSAHSEKNAEAIISALKQANHVELFRRSAEIIERIGGGALPTPDRLKRQQFTQELIGDLTAR
jgi:hypothetical protein